MTKVDIKKAHDRLEWMFLKKFLEVWGFSEEVRKILGSCVKTLKYFLMLNGETLAFSNQTMGSDKVTLYHLFFLFFAQKFCTGYLLRKRRKELYMASRLLPQ